MKLMKLSITAVLILFISGLSVAQTFTIKGDFRSRLEFRDGYGTLALDGLDAQNAAVFINQRSRLIFDFKDDKFESRFSIQDTRTWGDANILNNGSAVGLIKEGWMKYYFNDELALKVGRMELNYDDSRLIGSKNWKTMGASHDIGLLQYKNKDAGFEGHLGFALANVGEPKFSTDYAQTPAYKYMSLVWMKFNINENVNISFIDRLAGYHKMNAEGVNAGDTTAAMNTAGVNFNGKFGDFKARANFYYQTGTMNNAAETERSAYMFSLRAGYNIAQKFELGAGYEMYSGDDFSDTGDDVNNQFVADAKMNNAHLFLGNMDYFTNVPAHTQGLGITDIYFFIKAKLNNKLSTTATFHILGLANETLAGGTTVDKALGNEIDLNFTYKVTKGFAIKGGYSIMLPEQTLKDFKIAGAESATSHWGWMMLIFNPTFFSSSN